jgi:hypothetical protein
MVAAVSLMAMGPENRRLVELMQSVNFGRIEGLVVRDGGPVFNPRPRVVREIKFGAENGPRPETARIDFSLKTEVRELFAQLEALGNAVVGCIEVKHGLPFRMTVVEGDA